MNNNSKKTLGFTLGCRLNQADTALIFGRLEKEDFAIIKPGNSETPDIIIVNTCTVTANAAQKSRQTVRSFKRQYPDACIVVTGCDCDKAPENWVSEPAADLVVPNAGKKEIAGLVKQWKKDKKKNDILKLRSGNTSSAFESASIDTSFREDALADFPHKSRAFLKVQEGCNSFCTYCIVPYVRGRERSRNFREILDEAESLLEKGHKELVITGVNISTYKDGSRRIADLVSALTELQGDFRIRLSSMEPHPDNFQLVKLIAETGKICRFMHIPLQHGTDEILEKMGRNYTAANFAEFIYTAAETVPGIHLGTDIIVGFPGETDELFERSCTFIASLPLANTHIFRFSPREGTPAITMKPRIPQITAKKRAAALAVITEKQKKCFEASQKKYKLRILVEKQVQDGSFEGWSDNYIRIKLNGTDIKPGQFSWYFPAT